METTLVHVCRHGQVYNPDHVLYGRQPGYGLSDRGRAMAERLGEHFAGLPITHLRCSPLQRAQETMAPIAAGHPGLELVTDPRIVEAANILEGQSFGRYNQRLLLPRNLRHLYNPLRPSWGEPYRHIAERVGAFANEKIREYAGRQIIVVSHESPIWSYRHLLETGHPEHWMFLRKTALASITSITYDSDTGKVMSITYADPAAQVE